MKKSPTILAISLAMAISGCGSDSDSDSDPIAVTTTDTVSSTTHKNITIDVEPNDPLEGEITVYVGGFVECDSEGSAEHKAEYCDSNDNSLVVRDESNYKMVISAQQLKDTMGSSINQDVYVDGQYSILDVMLYVSKVRDDFELTLGEFDESIGTYSFTVNFDYDGDGSFDGPNDSKNDPNWYPRWTYTAGEFKREIGDPDLEAIYERSDEFTVRDNAEIRLEAFNDEVTKRRNSVMKAEVDRLNANGGDVVVPEIQVDFGDGRGYVTVATDVKVTPYNLRPDLFKEGVITIADALMSAYYNQGLDVEFTFWPTLGTGSNVDAFAVTGVDGQRANGFNGWLMYTGEESIQKDFFGSFFGRSLTSTQILADWETNGDASRYCAWFDDKSSIEQAQKCIDGWAFVFGGHMLHHMPDSWVMNYPHEVIQLKWATQNGLWKVAEFQADDGQFPTYDITEAVAPLTEDHFGWSIADCSQCHAVNEVHLNGDSPSLPDTAEPYYCAQCHGSNGAPVGHGETSRCHWCHSEDKLMVNHGQVSTKKQVSDVVCEGPEIEGILEAEYYGLPGACADYKTGIITVVHDKGGNASSYSDDMVVPGSSDWDMDEQFPDPYSCVTCHPNQ